ncbi:MAG TPA: hypothetical protein VNJ70_17815 [Thermoanaerobaculia bacterium]|nr:hypothetical protein [Thermoanaerobaculia bacterium]
MLTSARSLIVQAPSVAEVFWAAPPQEKSTHLRLQEAEGGGVFVLECAVMRPQDLSLTHGHELRLDNLEEMIASYDLGIQVATMNFDHAWGGPAHAWCERVWLDGDIFMARWVDLSGEAVEGIRSRRWFRQSGEVTMHHPATGGWYFEGMALLGAKAPAIWGLPPVRLERKRYVVNAGAPAPPTQLAAEEAAQEDVMKDPKKPADDGGVTQDPPAAPPPPVPPANPAALELAAMQAERTALADETKAARVERLAARRERVAAEVQRDLTALGSRLTPAMLKTGLRELLIELKAADTPLTLKFAVTAGGKEETVERNAYQVVLSALQAAPEFKALGAGELAGLETEDGAALARDHRTAEERAFDASNGISDERALELQRKYPVLRRAATPSVN